MWWAGIFRAYKACLWVARTAFVGIFFFSFCLSVGWAQPATPSVRQIQAKGIYTGTNLYVQNPLYKDLASFCIEEILLNGRLLLSSPTLSAIEVKLDHLSLGAKVDVRINHKQGCLPRVINPGVLGKAAWATFAYFMQVDDDICWKVHNEAPGTQYDIERLNSDEWEREQSLMGGASQGTYCYKPEGLSRGVNVFRIRSISSQIIRHTPQLEILVREKVITFSPKVVKSKMTLSEHAFFEILNDKKEPLLQGEARIIPLRRLKPGDYFIVIEGKEYAFTKR